MGTDFLNIIVTAKKEEVLSAKNRISEYDLRGNLDQSRIKRPFLENLSKPGPKGINIIAEIKRASPSKGDIRINLNPADYAAAYERGGACAISVLTDAPYFKGSLDDLKTARAHTRLPVLRKEFIISSYQLYETAAAQADAVLLIVRILDKNQLKDYLSLCGELNLDALVEIYAADEIETAAEAGAKLIGINNRDLSSFSTSIDRAMGLSSELKPGQIPVAASGIGCRGDILNTKKTGIFNFLIGESLVRAVNPEGFLASLF
jgi:indole-3-glycerol phosphate synthase